MRGIFVIARYSIMELMHGKMFWIILALALLVNALMNYGLYHAKNPIAEEIRNQQRQEQNYSQRPLDSPMSEGFSLKDQDVPILVFKNALRWLVYIIYIFFGNFLAIFGAVGLIAPELDKRSIYTLISKPLSRTHIFLGKFLGLFLTLLLYAVIMNIASQIFFLFSGAGFNPNLFLSSAIGFMNFLIFGLFALFLSTRIRMILAALLSVIILWSSTNIGVTFIKTIGKELFKFGDWVDYVILMLPSQKSIGNYAIHFIFDKYIGSFLHEVPQEVFELVTEDPRVLIQPAIWLGSVFVLCYLSFFRKEFD